MLCTVRTTPGRITFCTYMYVCIPSPAPDGDAQPLGSTPEIMYLQSPLSFQLPPPLLHNTIDRRTCRVPFRPLDRNAQTASRRMQMAIHTVMIVTVLLYSMLVMSTLYLGQQEQRRCSSEDGSVSSGSCTHPLVLKVSSRGRSPVQVRTSTHGARHRSRSLASNDDPVEHESQDTVAAPAL